MEGVALLLSRFWGPGTGPCWNHLTWMRCRHSFGRWKVVYFWASNCFGEVLLPKSEGGGGGLERDDRAR